MSWLGQNGASREDFASLADAYASMYQAAEEADKEQQQLNERIYSGGMTGNDKMPASHGNAPAPKKMPASHGNAPAPKKMPAVKNMPEEFESWVDQVLDEGADLSEFTWDEVYDYYVNEVLEEGELSSYTRKQANSHRSTDKGNTRHLNPNVKAKPSMDPDSNLNVKEEADLIAALADAYGMMYEKKKDSDKCGEDTYWDSEEKKCKSKKKKSNTTVVVGRGGYYGGGHHHGGSNGGESGGEGETEGGTDGGGDGGGGGGGE